jgi:hypothetical protein
MVIEDSSVLRCRIENTIDKDKIFGYTTNQKVKNLKAYKNQINELLQNWMYPKDEYASLHALQNEIDNHLSVLNAL